MTPETIQKSAFIEVHQTVLYRIVIVNSIKAKKKKTLTGRASRINDGCVNICVYFCIIIFKTRIECF